MTNALLTPPAITDATRREFIALLGAAGLVAGCAGSSPPPAPTPSRVTVDLGTGPVEIPADPRRVAALEGRDDLDLALTVGLSIVCHPVQSGSGVPVLLSGIGGVSPHLSAALATAVGEVATFARGELNLEAVARSRPDLILCDVDQGEQVGDELRALAPVLVVDGERDWRELGAQLAAALGRPERFDAVRTRYEEAVTRIRRDRATALGSRVVIFQPDTNAVYVESPNQLRGKAVTEAGGLLAPAMERARAEGSLEVSYERLDEVLGDADAAIVVITSEGIRAQLTGNPLWQAARLVQADHVVTTDFWGNYGGALTATGVTAVVDELYRQV